MTPEEWGRLTPPQQTAFIQQYGPPPAHYAQSSPYQTAVAPPLPAVPTPKKSRKGLWIGLGVVALLLIIGIANSGKSGSATTGSALPTIATVPAAQSTAAAAPQAAGPATQIGDGNYQVGVDIAAGRYKTAGPGGNGALDICYWQRTKDDSGDFDSIISNDLFKGPGSVTVKKGEFVKLTGGCTWTKQ